MSTQERRDIVAIGFNNGSWGSKCGEKKFRCNLCPDGPSFDDRLRTKVRHVLSDAHLKVVPEEEPLRKLLAFKFTNSNLQCPHCMRWYSRIDSLRRHLDVCPEVPIAQARLTNTQELAHEDEEEPRPDPTHRARDVTADVLLTTYSFEGLAPEELMVMLESLTAALVVLEQVLGDPSVDQE